MSVLVVNCNHWIGFHVVNAMLEAEYQLDGMIDPEIDDDLMMFFGRNSHFHLVEKKPKKVYDTCIVIGGHEITNITQAKKRLVIQLDGEKEDVEENTTIVRPPLLFGEWMPMNEKGLYRNNNFISFESEEFKNQALSVHDFTSVLMQLLKAPTLSNYIDINPSDQTENTSIFTRENSSIQKQVEHVKRHYQIYRNFYQNLG